MGGPLRTSPEGLELIMGFEGFRARASRLADGRWLIGYGHTRTARKGLSVSRSDAELILAHADLPPIEAMIREQVLTPLSQNEFDALVSFAWNIGPGVFRNSAVLARLNEGDRLAAAGAMWLWRKGRIAGEVKVIDALVRRRAAEISLFLTHPSGPAPVPGALIRPMADEAGARGAPADAERSVIIEARPEPDTGAAAPRPSSPYPSGPVLTQPQAAARAVGERIARILAETPREPATPAAPPPETGPSVEEITRAIADLAGPADEPASPAQPKGPPDGIERRRGLRPADGEAQPLPPVSAPPAEPSEAAPAPGAPPAEPPLPPAETYVIDDLAPAAIDETSLRRAITENGRAPKRNGAEALGRWLPFALLSGLGLVGLVAGVQRFIGQAAQTQLSQHDVWLVPLLSLGGGFLFVIATYYLYRAMTQHD